MMRIDFDELVDADVDTVYAYMRSPQDWTRLYGSFGDTVDRGDGWVAIPLRRFPFPLVARITSLEEPGKVTWELRGFFKGTGEVRISPQRSGTQIRGFEEVAIPRMLGIGNILEQHYLEPRFRRLWAGGWRRLRHGTARLDLSTHSEDDT